MGSSLPTGVTKGYGAAILSGKSLQKPASFCVVQAGTVIAIRMDQDELCPALKCLPEVEPK